MSNLYKKWIGNFLISLKYWSNLNHAFLAIADLGLEVILGNKNILIMYFLVCILVLRINSYNLFPEFLILNFIVFA